MVSTGVLAALLLTATVTDVRRRRVYNWTTYPGALLALAANGVATACGLALDSPLNGRWGLVGLQDSLAGCLACGFIMLVCYVFFPGGVGGGDVKLLAMMGAFLGPWRGLEALLWTFVLGACVAIGLLVWREGAIRLLARALRRIGSLLRLPVGSPPPGEAGPQSPTDVFLSPAALAAVLIVQFQLSRWL